MSSLSPFCGMRKGCKVAVVFNIYVNTLFEKPLSYFSIAVLSSPLKRGPVVHPF